MHIDFRQTYIEESLSYFKRLKALGDKTLVQLRPEEFHNCPDADSNSAAMLIQHLHGNIMARWGLLADRKIAARNKRLEFSHSTLSAPALLEMWEHAWHTLFVAFEKLTPEMLLEIVEVEAGLERTYFETIERQKAHYAYHIGQLVYLSKHIVGPAWLSLSIPVKL